MRFRPAASGATSRSTTGEWHSARLDLLPLIRRGVAAMQAKGQFVHTMPEDLELTGMNFGWEVPGTFDAGLQIRNLSIRIVE